MKPTHAQIVSGIVQLVREATADWDLDLEDLGPDSKLVADLCFSSVDFVHLVASVEMRYGRKLQFEKLLIRDGAYRTELTVGELAQFVDDEYDHESQGPRPA
ncbi:MAG: acyl carrier protein [Candidatus Riflebacteria bacterium]|nr:acyl carrier protein [Candidatus Riflebacteria bacterium]